MPRAKRATPDKSLDEIKRRLAEIDGETDELERAILTSPAYAQLQQLRNERLNLRFDEFDIENRQRKEAAVKEGKR